MNGRDLPKLLDDYVARLERENPQYTYGVDEGRDYLKIWRRPTRGTEGRSAVMFVGRDGTLYRAESWKKRGRPLSHLRETQRDRRSRRDERRSSPRDRFTVLNGSGRIDATGLSETSARQYAQRWSKESGEVFMVIANHNHPERRRRVAIYQRGVEKS